MRIKELSEQLMTVSSEITRISEQFISICDTKIELYKKKNHTQQTEDLLIIEQQLAHLDRNYYQCNLNLTAQKKHQIEIQNELTLEIVNVISTIGALNTTIIELIKNNNSTDSISPRTLIEDSPPNKDAAIQQLISATEELQEIAKEAHPIIQKVQEQQIQIETLLNNGLFFSPPPIPAAGSTAEVNQNINGLY